MHDRIKTIVVRDSRLPGEKTDAASIVVNEGPSAVSYQRVQPSDPTSTNPVFTIDLPSQRTGLSRTLYWEMQGKFTVTGTDLDKFAASDRIALRQFPIQSMCTSLTAKINDTPCTIGSINQILPALLRAANPASSTIGVQSGTAASPDYTSNYEHAVGRSNSPFRPVTDVGVGSPSPPRTIGLDSISVTPPGAGLGTTMEVEFTVREPLILPPFGYTNAANERAIYGCNQVQISATMGDFHRGLSLAIPTGTAITGVTMRPVSQSILAVFITPTDRALALAASEAQIFRYNYNAIQSYFTTLTGGAVDDGASVSGSSNSIMLPVVPDKILVYAMYSEEDRMNQTHSLADAFMPITDISIQAGTRSGILSGATSMDMYSMSYNNGARIPYYNYSGATQVSSSNSANRASGSGGPLVLDVAADLSLPEGVTPGMSAQYSFAVNQVTCVNRYGRAITAPRLAIVVVTGGFLEIKSGATKVVSGGVTTLNSDELRLAPRLSSIEYHKSADDAGIGGSKFGDWLKGAVHTIGHVANEVISVAPQLAIQALSKGAGELGGGMLGGGYVGGGQLGGAQLGGARMRQSSLYR